MSELRNQMKMDLELRGYSPITMKYYIQHVIRLSQYFNKSPDLLGEDEYINTYTIVSLKEN